MSTKSVAIQYFDKINVDEIAVYDEVNAKKFFSNQLGKISNNRENSAICYLLIAHRYILFILYKNRL